MEKLAMKESDFEIFGAYVQDHLVEWMIGSNALSLYFAKMSAEYENSLTERIVRVEEALKHQGDLIEKILHQMDKRFEQVDKRFEQVDKRFEQMQTNMDKRFEEMRIDMNNRFEQMRLDMDKRFEQMDKRFEQIDKRFRQMFAYFTSAFVIIGALAVVYPVFT